MARRARRRWWWQSLQRLTMDQAKAWLQMRAQCISSIPPAGKACAVTFAAHRPDIGLTEATEARTVKETARGGVIRLPGAAVCIPSTQRIIKVGGDTPACVPRRSALLSCS